eukprot:4335368-Pyramimonas_sp.AAC.1
MVNITPQLATTIPWTSCCFLLGSGAGPTKLWSALSIAILIHGAARHATDATATSERHYWHGGGNALGGHAKSTMDGIRLTSPKSAYAPAYATPPRLTTSMGTN